jgi:hypothetical protein
VFSTLLLLAAVPILHGREHKRKVKAEDYGLGFSTEIASPESEVLQAVEAIVNDGVIQGSKEYNKDKYIENASPATSSPLFPEWKEPGKGLLQSTHRRAGSTQFQGKQGRRDAGRALRSAEQRRVSDHLAD